jgi:hypothetical protein
MVGEGGVLNRQPILGKVGLPDAMVGQYDIPKPMQNRIVHLNQ